MYLILIIINQDFSADWQLGRESWLMGHVLVTILNVWQQKQTNKKYQWKQEYWKFGCIKIQHVTLESSRKANKCKRLTESRIQMWCNSVMNMLFSIWHHLATFRAGFTNFHWKSLATVDVKACLIVVRTDGDLCLTVYVVFVVILYTLKIYL